MLRTSILDRLCGLAECGLDLGEPAIHGDQRQRFDRGNVAHEDRLIRGGGDLERARAIQRVGALDRERRRWIERARTNIYDEVRRELCAEAIRMARIVVDLLPTEPEAVGLLALMLLTDARRPAREGPGGEMVRLEDQARTR